MRNPTVRLLTFGSVLLLAFAAVFNLYCQDRGRDKFIKVFFPSGKAVTAELAVTDAERQKGLMFREEILPDQGMLFVFEEEGIQSFWMKNTLIPLDLLWLDSGKRIIHIERDVPPCKQDPCPTYGPDGPARYVLELKAGEAAANVLKLSDRLQFVLPERVLKIMR